MLKFLPAWADATVTRTRDAAVLDTLDMVVDVGAVYDASKNRFDHHQRGFDEVLAPFKTKLSSAGLVYKHFGRDVLANILDEDAQAHMDKVYHKVYQSFVEGIDGIDNGVNQYDTDLPPRYSVKTDLSSRVAGLNPSWNDENQDTEAGFAKAIEMVRAEFLDSVNYFAKSWLPARKVVEAAAAARTDVHESGRIIELSRFCPWKEHLFDIEDDMGIDTPIYYALFADSAGSWRVCAVPASRTAKFENRLPLPEAWRGVRDDALSQLTGIDGCIFVHASGFIGGAKTREGALALASQAVEMAGNKRAKMDE